MSNFRKLKVWVKAVELATMIYEITGKFPKTEIYGITSQMRRSAVSISSNIAEGAGRISNSEFRNFLHYAKGSCYELETQLRISKNLEYLSDVEFLKVKKHVIEIQKMLHSLIEKLTA